MEVHDEWTDVPRVSAFHGIVIAMFFNESRHAGRPHFHAEFAGAWASYDIASLDPIAGRLPPDRHRLVVKRARLHQDELRLDWDLLHSTGQLVPIAPLP